MRRLLVDTNVILDLFLDDPEWAEWAQLTLERYDGAYVYCINSVVYAELSIGFQRIEELEAALSDVGFNYLSIPKESLFLAGKAFLQYRRRGGSKRSPLPDFFIGAHAAVLEMPLMTRDAARYHTYFPSVSLITPENN